MCGDPCKNWSVPYPTHNQAWDPFWWHWKPGLISLIHLCMWSAMSGHSKTDPAVGDRLAPWHSLALVSWAECCGAYRQPSQHSAVVRELWASEEIPASQPSQSHTTDHRSIGREGRHTGLNRSNFWKLFKILHFIKTCQHPGLQIILQLLANS